MVKFKKPKRNKSSLREKEKLDIDALEAEAVSAGLGAEDLGSRKDGRRQNLKEEQERIEAEMNAYQLAYARADDASKALRQEQRTSMQTEYDDTPVFDDDDDELRKSLERARKIALRKQDDEKTVLQAITRLATSSVNDSTSENPNIVSGEQDNKVIFTEMDEFVWGLQLDEGAQKPDSEDFLWRKM